MGMVGNVDIDVDVESGSLKDFFLFSFFFFGGFLHRTFVFGFTLQFVAFSPLLFLARRCRFDADSSAVYSMG